MEKDLSTQNKIVAAARVVFLQKGYDGTRTRDIAAQAGVNLALLNYYFRSKENLYEVVMKETLHSLIGRVADLLNREDTSFEAKVGMLVHTYLDQFLAEPQLPFFVVSELNKNPKSFAASIQSSGSVASSVFAKQYTEGVISGAYRQLDFAQFILNLGGLMIFPFLIRPSLVTALGSPDEAFTALIERRRVMITQWCMQMIAA